MTDGLCGKKPVEFGHGFTLVELLVVISLLSLVMLAMVSALRTTAQTEERFDLRLQRNDEMRVASDFLRGILGRISARKLVVPIVEGESQFAFRGEDHELTWVGIMPARYGAGGRYHFRLSMDAAPSGHALVVRFIPWVDDSVPLDWTGAQAHTLVTNISELTLQYEDAEAEPPVWTPHWLIADRLPQRVRVGIRTANGPWPELVVAMRIAPGSDPGSSGAVFGGSQ